MSVRRAVAAPCFADDPMDLVRLAVEAERAGFDGFFIWDHITFANDGLGPSIVDPWAVLSVAAAQTSTIVLGPMITPVPRRRPWVLARQTVTLDRLAHGRTVFGVGLGSPAYGDFGIFGDEIDDRTRAAMLDEGLDVMAGLWTGEPFSYRGRHYRLDTVRFLPTPEQGRRIPVWVGGVLPAKAPMRRAARWDGAVPITYVDRALTRPTAEEMAWTRDLVLAERGSLDGFDLVVWAEVAADPVAMLGESRPTRRSGRPGGSRRPSPVTAGMRTCAAASRRDRTATQDKTDGAQRRSGDRTGALTYADRIRHVASRPGHIGTVARATFCARARRAQEAPR